MAERKRKIPIRFLTLQSREIAERECSMNQTEIRTEIRSNGLYIYEVANALGVKQNTFYKMLNELSPKYEEQIKKVISDLSSENTRIYRKMDGTRLETIYYCMHTRCYSKKHRSYRNYGARGIKICDEWLGRNGKANFYKWALSHGYKENLTIDRINVDGDYEPDNCRWLDYAEQNKNKRTCISLIYNDKEITPIELSKITGINVATIYARYRKGIRDFTYCMPKNG